MLVISGNELSGLGKGVYWFDVPFATGDEVIVRTLGNKRGVVVAAARAGRYQVRVANVTLWCREEDLAPPPVPGKRRRTGTRQEAPPAPHDRGAAMARIDLHGLTVEEALARVMDAIDRALRDGADRMEIVHGKGSGRIRDALHRQLPSLPVVASLRLDPANAGVTWVYFR